MINPDEVVLAADAAADELEAGKFKVEVIADSTETWVSNALTFPSKAIAADYGRNLAARWTAVRHWRVVPIKEPKKDE